jgi:coenzyme PQQ biosynthesis protein PqqD
MVPAEIRYAKAPEVVTRRIADETLLVPIRAHVGDLDSIFTLDEVATAIWQRIDGKTTVARIAELLRDEFDAPDDVEQDVDAFLASLHEAGLIRPVPHEGPETAGLP